MIGALVWKEYREQRSIWLALAVLAVLALVVLPLAYTPEPRFERGFRDALTVVALAVAATYSLVCGAMLLAGESEAGTQRLLDALPAPRLALWLGKLVAGVALVAALLALVAALALAGGVVPEETRALGGVLLLLVGPLGLSWGMLSSAGARTVLGAVGLALLNILVVVPAVALALLCPAAAVFALGLNAEPPRWLFLALCAALLFLPPLPLSALIYTRLDRARWAGAPTAAGPSAPRLGAWRQSAWLAWRQTRGLLPGLLLFALLAGVFVIGRGLVLWPLLTLTVGAICGVTAFLDEQAGAYRFLGDQRFPLGRLWAVKIAARLGLGLLALGVMTVPLAVASLARAAYHPADERELPLVASTLGGRDLARAVPLFVFFAGPVVTGLAVGHLVGLLFRKALVALVVAVGLSVLLVAVWWPSMIAGGLSAWQVFAPPLALLAGARLLLPLWAGDRLQTPGGAARVGAAAVIASGLIAAGLWYRAAELPDVEEPADLAAWEAALPPPERNEGGQLVRRGLAQLADVRRSLQDRKPKLEGARDFRTQAQLAAVDGWTDPLGELGEWLDEVFQRDWHRALAQAAALPPGTVEDPRRYNFNSASRTYDNAEAAGALLAARGLQRQRADADPAAFVECLRTGLALSRHMAHNATFAGARTGRVVERVMLLALERWLEGLAGRPDLLRRALAVLREHAAAPADHRPALYAEYLIARDGLDRPLEWDGHLDGPILGLGNRDQDTEVVTTAWGLPWERQRRERLLRLAFWARERVPADALHYLYVIVPNALHRGRDSTGAALRARADRAAVVLLVALRLYQAEKGRPAESLDALVPAYLPAVPADPYAGLPFGYRLSKGEAIDWPAANGGPQRPVAEGQGVLWSVGEDRQDDGGTRQGPQSDGSGNAAPGADLIWLVPPPADKGG
jgi:hypothetical protein